MAHYTWYSVERIVSAMEENPDRTPQKSRRITPLKMPSLLQKKTVRAIEPETINSCWRKLCPDVMHDFTGFMTMSIKEIMK